MDRDFLARSYRSTMVLAAVAFPFVLVYLGPRFALGAGAGALLGLLNLRLVEGLVVNWLRPEGARVARVALAAILKLALVFGVGTALLASEAVPPAAVGVGFPLVLAVIFLKALGRLYLARAGVGPVAPPATHGHGEERR
jgi:protein-S-isoprenylcysteine O-methyltransferase Ste14